MDSLILIVVFVATYLVSRVIKERALRVLSRQDKATLVEGFSGYRISHTVVLAVIVLFYVGTNLFFSDSLESMTPVFIAVLFNFLVISSIISYYKLKALNMPATYVKSFVFGEMIQFIGIVFLFFPVIARLFYTTR
jgi:hypothetical protein